MCLNINVHCPFTENLILISQRINYKPSLSQSQCHPKILYLTKGLKNYTKKYKSSFLDLKLFLHQTKVREKYCLCALFTGD